MGDRLNHIVHRGDVYDFAEDAANDFIKRKAAHAECTLGWMDPSRTANIELIAALFCSMPLTAENVFLRPARLDGRHGERELCDVLVALRGHGIVLSLKSQDATTPREGPMLRRRLHDVGVAMRRGCTISAIEPGGVAGESEFGERFELETDAVVLVTQRLSNDALYFELSGDEERLRAEGVEAVYRVGDCVAPQLLADAIFDGHRLAREIDSDDPAVPLPHLRERVAL